LRKAARDAPEEDPLHVVTQAELLLDERRPKEALDTLLALPRKHTAALKLELRAQQQLRQWDSVTAVLGELERREVLDADQASKLRTHATAESVKRKGRDLHALDDTWKKLTDTQKRETVIAAGAAQCYIALGRSG